jgi:hypothetical protein
MCQTLGYLSAATLGLMGIVALATAHDPDPGPEVLLLWAVACLAALLTLTQGVAASVQRRQLAWLAGLLAVGLVSILGLVVTFLIPTYPNWMLGGIRLEDLINVVPFLPACVGVVGLVYSLFLRAPPTPTTALAAGDSRAAGAASPPPPAGA